MKKKWKIILSAILLSPIVLVAIAFTLLYNNQHLITAQILETVNENYTGELIIKESKIALLKGFPYISIDLKGVKFYEDKQRSTQPLYEAEDVYIGFNINEVLKGQYNVKSLIIIDGHIDIIKLADGSINILNAKNLSQSFNDSTQTEIHLDLQKIEIRNFMVNYSDLMSCNDVKSDFSALKAKIRYVSNHFFIDLETALDFDLYKDGSPTFFTGKHIELDAEIDFDEKTHLLQILPSKISLNDAHFKVDGTIDIDDDFDMDIRLRGDKPDFNIFAAFAPPEIEQALKNYQNSGKIFFDGSVKGKSINGHIPKIHVDFGCENAYFLHKQAGKKVDDLRFQGSFSNEEGGTIESFVLQLTHFYAKPEEGVFEGRLLVKNFKDPYIKVNLHADLDLEFLGEFFQIQDLKQTKGKILLDMDFDEMVDLEFPGENLAQLKKGIDSELTIKNLEFLVPGYPHRVKQMNGHAIMRQGVVTLDSLAFKVGNSDLNLSGMLSDFPALFHRFNKDVRIELQANSQKIDLSQLLSFDKQLAEKFDETIEDFFISMAFNTTAKQLFEYKYLPKGEFFIDDLYAKFKHYPHALHDFDVDIIITDKELKIIDFSGEIDSSDFHFNGVLSNYPKWFQEVPIGDTKIEFDFASHYFKINDVLSYKGESYVPDDYKNEVLRNVDLHGRVELHYDKEFKSADFYLDKLNAKLNIHPLKLEQFKGRAHYEDDHLTLENFGGKMGNSDFVVNMTYYLGEDKSLKKRHNNISLYANALDLDELMNYEGPEKEVNHEEAFNVFEIPFADITISADIKRLNYHKYWLENLNTHIRIKENHHVFVDTFFMKVADGYLQMQGYFNGSNPENIYYHSNINAKNLDIDKLMIKFDNFGQDQLINENIHGKISGNIKSTFKMHPDFTPIIEKSEAHMELMITEGSLVKFPPLQAVSNYFKDKNLNLVRFDTLQNVLDLKDGVVSFPSMTINSTLGFLELSGRQGLDMTMEYFIRIPMKLVTQVGFRALFGGKNAEEVDPEQIDEIQARNEEKKVRFLNLKVSGTSDDYKISLGKEK
jgi:hypothetical protein